MDSPSRNIPISTSKLRPRRPLRQLSPRRSAPWKWPPKSAIDAPLGCVFKGRRPPVKSSGRTRPAAIRSSRGSCICADWKPATPAPSPRASTSTARRRERTIGRPASYGCIRMRSRDVVRLFERCLSARRSKCVNTSDARAPLSAARSELRRLMSRLRTRAVNVRRP